MYVEHALIRPRSVLERDYRTRPCPDLPAGSYPSSCFPPGSASTVVALRVAAEVLVGARGKVLFLAPTKPLVVQIATYLRDNLVGRSVDMMTGENTPPERQAIWEGSDVIVATPQAAANDLRPGSIDLGRVSLLVFDEAHRAVGSYAYVEVAANNREALVLGMTASPGATRKRIVEVCRNLGVRELEWREEKDEDVAPVCI